MEDLTGACSQVCTWHMRPSKRGPGQPDHVKACEWHQKAAAKNVIQSVYAYGQHCAQGLGRTIDMAEAHSFFMKAAAGHSPMDEGALTDVQWVCPGCGHWSYNEVKSPAQPRCSEVLAGLTGKQTGRLPAGDGFATKRRHSLLGLQGG